MNEFTSWHQDTLGERTVKALIKNNFGAAYVKTAKEAMDKILALVPKEAAVGIGGSWTLSEMGMTKTLEARGNTVYDHNKPGLAPEESMALRRKQLTCDVFMTSANAVTLDGQIVNVDGAGNRVAAMIFGPKKVIIVAGVNKIARDVADGQNAHKALRCPINVKRLNRQNPCVQSGECMDCQLPTRICNVTTIMHKKPAVTDVQVFIVGEDLGF